MLIYPYRRGSRSVRGLKETIPARAIKLEGSRFRGREDKVVINWGNSRIDNAEVNRCRVLNLPHNVRTASNKLSFFQATSETEGVKEHLPPWTADMQQALGWIGEGHHVVCRAVLSGHSAEGLTIANHPDNLPLVPLYTRYVPKKYEYRVHVVLTGDDDAAVHIARKARNRDIPDEQVDWRIRNHQNGFIYASTEGVFVPPDLGPIAIQVVRSVGLDFGAVDLIWNERHAKTYVLEVNTAPGLEGRTLQYYAEQFRRIGHA